MAKKFILETELISFNKPHLSGNELIFIQDVLSSNKISGNGKYTQLCQSFLGIKYGFGKCLLTGSCTDALEMAAILCDIQPGDEVILPSFTFVSTANAFVLRGAKLIFVDSCLDHPGMDGALIEKLITNRTKVIIPVHYAGVACDMDTIMEIAERYNLLVVEDAAQAIDSYFIGQNGLKRALGSIGHLSAFSFHETKNIISGEGGMLAINDMRFAKRAEIIWEKGTNRSSFFRGEVDKYGWVDIGSSFLPSEITAAFLWAQLENIQDIQDRRLSIWNNYLDGLKLWSQVNGIKLPFIPHFASNNAHMFYMILPDDKARELFITKLREEGINAVFHYLSLHKSPYYFDKHDGRNLPLSDFYSDCLVRLPFYYDLSEMEQQKVIDVIQELKF
jgi:dTDP-4-amino-4,6-dideoxygalactose transaminase